jgi:hypothetical protein
MKKLLIIDCLRLDASPFEIHGVRSQDLCQANLVILRTSTHFRCVKNRFDYSSNDEKIPNRLLEAYLLNYVEYFTKEEILNSLI